MVDDLIGMAPSNHGTTALMSCLPDVTTCAPAVCSSATRRASSNSRAETFRGVSYTVITTERDETVTPMTSSFLSTGAGRITNVAVQDLCPTDLYEHDVVGIVDPVSYALVTVPSEPALRCYVLVQGCRSR